MNRLLSRLGLLLLIIVHAFSVASGAGDCDGVIVSGTNAQSLTAQAMYPVSAVVTSTAQKPESLQIYINMDERDDIKCDNWGSLDIDEKCKIQYKFETDKLTIKAGQGEAQVAYESDPPHQAVITVTKIGMSIGGPSGEPSVIKGTTDCFPADFQKIKLSNFKAPSNTCIIQLEFKSGLKVDNVTSGDKSCPLVPVQEPENPTSPATEPSPSDGTLPTDATAPGPIDDSTTTKPVPGPPTAPHTGPTTPKPIGTDAPKTSGAPDPNDAPTSTGASATTQAPAVETTTEAESNNLVIIIVCVCVGVVVLLIIVGILVYCFCFKKKKDDEEDAEAGEGEAGDKDAAAADGAPNPDAKEPEAEPDATENTQKDSAKNSEKKGSDQTQSEGADNTQGEQEQGEEKTAD